MATDTYAVCATPTTTNTNQTVNFCQIFSKTTTGFTILRTDTGNTGIDRAFDFIVAGVIL